MASIPLQREACGRPPRLRPGARIGILAPSSPFDRESFEQGLAVWKALGYAPVTPAGLFERRGYLAGSDIHRAQALHALAADPAISALACVRGGYGALRLLERLDYKLIAGHPKIILGFSDVTALLAAVQARCGLVVFHGPLVTTLAGAGERTRQGLQAALAADRPLALDMQDAMVIRPGRAQGPVRGGNLTTLCHLVGTPFEPDLRGSILFLEDRGEAPYRLDRMLTQMRLAGSLQGAAAVVLGAFEACGAPDEVFAIVEETFAPMGIPIVAGLPAGHGEPNLTLPLGLPAVLDTAGRSLTFREPATVAGP